jgi:hypothetical protein
MRIDPKQYVTVGHAAEIAGVSRYWMRQLAQAGTVASVDIDGQWFVLRSAAAAYQRPCPAEGRPRKRRK